MEFKTTVKAEARVCATLEEDGRLTIKVFASAEYAPELAPGCTTTAEVFHKEIPPELCERVREALEEILKASEEKLGPRVQKAIHKSAEVAAAHGEI